MEQDQLSEFSSLSNYEQTFRYHSLLSRFQQDPKDDTQMTVHSTFVQLAKIEFKIHTNVTNRKTVIQHSLYEAIHFNITKKGHLLWKQVSVNIVAYLYKLKLCFLFSSFGKKGKTKG